MTGLLIKEMLMRKMVERILIVTPGGLTKQWQEDEMGVKFNLPFTLVNSQVFNSDPTIFQTHDRVVVSIDLICRDKYLKVLENTSWDLVIFDEAHKLSAYEYGLKTYRSRRYEAAFMLSQRCEHVLLLTATPHRGRQDTFKRLLQLLDEDIFATSDIAADRIKELSQDGLNKFFIRRLKEDMKDWDGNPLYVKRSTRTVSYQLTPEEKKLYDAVTKYLTKRKEEAISTKNIHVTLALAVMQRRLVSSIFAIKNTLQRRWTALQELVDELDRNPALWSQKEKLEDLMDYDNVDDYEDLDDDEKDALDAILCDPKKLKWFTTASSPKELKHEAQEVKALYEMANNLYLQNQEEKKYTELKDLLRSQGVVDGEKLVLFTEHKDTLNYLKGKIASLLGDPNAVITIQGGMSRDDRRHAEDLFKQSKDVRILLATDAAGEGINLQRAHLMINYDLPWNPNRLEQRFGRIHRIGQTEGCHLWNLVSQETREGMVFQCLFNKLEEERAALGGKVFDILGDMTFDNKPLRDLLIEAIRYGNDPEVRQRLWQVVDHSMNTEKFRELITENALTEDSMDVSKVMEIRAEMERMEAHKLQPHFVEAFFLQAFKTLGGRIHKREHGRYEITSVPFAIRNRDMQIGFGESVLNRYERICFEKERVQIPGGVTADLVCPGHPLLDATVSVILEQSLGTLRQGAVLVDDDETADTPRFLFYVESAIQDGTVLPDGTKKTVSRAVHFVEIDYDGNTFDAGYAPYLDYRPATEAERASMEAVFAEELGWLESDPDKIATDFAIRNIIPEHIGEVRTRTLAQVAKVQKAVDTRLRAEINYWDYRAGELADREHAGKKNARLNSKQAERRANELAERLKRRMDQLDRQKQLSPMPPRVVGGALVVPASMLHESATTNPNGQSADAATKRKTELAAMDAIMAIERELGYAPRDVSEQRGIGYDILSRVPDDMRDGDDPVTRMVEVKGRIAGGDSITLTKNEILCGLNKPECWLLAIVEVDGRTTKTTYLRRPALRAPSFAENSVNYDMGRLIESAEVVLERTDTWL